jgi:hypothetical protein
MTTKAPDLLFYDCIFLRERHADYPGMSQWIKLNRFVGNNTSLVDRSGTITMPVRTKLLPWLSIPKSSEITESFDDICGDRSRQLWEKSKQLDSPLVVMWSGGIDSTLVLCSLLSTASLEDLDRLVVLLNRESIIEYPWFYHNIILKNQLRVDSSEIWHRYVNDKHIVVTGEGGDQLTGSFVRSLMNKFQFDTGTFTQSRFNSAFEKIDQARDLSVIKDLVIDCLQKSATVEMQHVLSPIWWMTFCLDWQYRYIDALINLPKYVSHCLCDEFVEKRWVMFFDDDSLQRWAMSNQFLLLEEHNKQTFKEYIFQYTKDRSYLNHKMKQSSMMNIRRCRPARYGIDSTWNLLEDFVPHHFNKGNSFDV